jgi:glutathione S-transferase
MKKPDLTLYVDTLWDSPWAMSAFVALTEKGVDFEVREVNLQKKEHFTPAYPSRTRRIPMLEADTFQLAESSAIAEYLEELFPPPQFESLLPKKLTQRATCREVMAWMRSDFMPLRKERPTTSLFFNKPINAPLSPEATTHMERFLKGVDSLVEEGRLTLFDQWCLADTDLALMLQRLNLNGTELPKKVKAFAEAQWERPSVKHWREHARPSYPA